LQHQHLTKLKVFVCLENRTVLQFVVASDVDALPNGSRLEISACQWNHCTCSEDGGSEERRGEEGRGGEGRGGERRGEEGNRIKPFVVSRSIR
jgi:hypothetical protein